MKDGKLNGKREARRAARIDELIRNLSADSGLTRARSRAALVGLGSEAVSALKSLLEDENPRLRWEAAKALVEIADRTTAPALVSALTDKEFDVRWLAAEALIALGRPGTVAVLRRLMRPPHTPWLREGAHHVLSETTDPADRERVKRVVETLNGPGWAERSAIAAAAALVLILTTRD
jgi:HEAT repeat protein